MPRYRQFGNKTAIMSADGSMKIVPGLTHDADQEVHVHLVPSDEDEDDTFVTDAELRRMVDKLGPTVRRRRISDEEEAFSDVIEEGRLTRRAVEDADHAASQIRKRERDADAYQDKLNRFWEKVQSKT